jgi:3,4-dihydroxy 2-butanone 4-phosphate synthase/GTP cyclohydrolase II
MSVEAVIEQIRGGGLAVVADDAQREDEGDLIVAADAMTEEKMAFFLEHTSGVICVSLDRDRCDQLQLPLMVTDNQEGQGTAFTVSVDLKQGVTTGISAQDRASTISSLADVRLKADAFVRPGHVFPLRSQDGGVLRRRGHTEAALDLARLSGRPPAGVLCEVTSPDRCRMASAPELAALSSKHGLPMCTVADLVRYRTRTERLVDHKAVSGIVMREGAFSCDAWRSVIDGIEHLSLTYGDVSGAGPILVRLHSECVTGDVFGSARCDCGDQLRDSMARIAEAGCGVVIYLRGHEGRGVGLAQKIAAYSLQDAGYDTYDANVALGLPVDSRDYGVGVQILQELGVEAVRLMTNNPAKCEALIELGLEVVERVPVPPRITEGNLRYLSTKRDRMGHLLTTLGTL